MDFQTDIVEIFCGGTSGEVVLNWKGRESGEVVRTEPKKINLQEGTGGRP